MGPLDFKPLLEAILSGTELHGANLTDVKLLERDGDQMISLELTGAKYNDQTKWPLGFGPPIGTVYDLVDPGVNKASYFDHDVHE